MYVCVCKAVSDRAIRKAVDGGICTVKGLKDQLGLGSVCGRCVPEARALIEQVRPIPLSALPSNHAPVYAAA